MRVEVGRKPRTAAGRLELSRRRPVVARKGRRGDAVDLSWTSEDLRGDRSAPIRLEVDGPTVRRSSASSVTGASAPPSVGAGPPRSGATSPDEDRTVCDVQQGALDLPM
jgi:hypothetical protein